MTKEITVEDLQTLNEQLYQILETIDAVEVDKLVVDKEEYKNLVKATIFMIEEVINE